MIQTISISEFNNAFINMNREENFSYEARNLLFEYLEQIEEDTGEQIELDVIAICCSFREADIAKIIDDYSIDVDDCTNEDEKLELVRKYLAEETSVVGETSTGFVYQAF